MTTTNTEDRSIRIAGHPVGDGPQTFLIAEAGINHNGSLELAKDHVREAEQAGADAVKFQTYSAEDRVGTDSPLYETLKQCELSESVWHELAEFTAERDVLFFSTAFDPDDVALLQELDVPAFKAASFHIAHKRLLRAMAETGKPTIFSRGMADEGEIRDAIEIFEKRDSPHALLHCVSSYPTESDDANLNIIRTLRREFNCPVGYSDHTLGTMVPAMSVAVGGTIIEKHFTVDKTLSGPDHEMSADPTEFAELVECVRETEAMLGSGEIRLLDCEEGTTQFRKESL